MYAGSSSTDILLGLLLAAFATVLTIAGAAWLHSASDAEAPGPEDQGCIPWHEEAIWLGLLGVLGGVILVVLANRPVAFGVFSYYTVPASLAALIARAAADGAGGGPLRS